MAKNVIIAASNKCYVKCPGCYNFFTNKQYTIDNKSILSFLDIINPLKIVDKVTISSGDPLLRKDIIILLKDINNRGFNINLDTVGICILDMNGTDLDTIKESIKFIGIPLDGGSQSIVYGLK